MLLSYDGGERKMPHLIKARFKELRYPGSSHGSNYTTSVKIYYTGLGNQYIPLFMQPSCYPTDMELTGIHAWMQPRYKTRSSATA